MKLTQVQKNQLLLELSFTASKSGGPGGQHVNKVNTKVELRFSINNSKVLRREEKDRLKSKLKNKINAEGELILTDTSSRSQIKNKENSIERFFEMIEESLVPEKKRTKTVPTAGSKIKRIEQKKQQSEKKRLRKTPRL